MEENKTPDMIIPTPDFHKQKNSNTFAPNTLSIGF
jgi:hypothetical protein